MITVTKAHKGECNNCKQQYHDGDGASLFFDKDSLITYMKEDDWLIPDEEKEDSWCPDCWRIGGSDSTVVRNGEAWVLI